VLVKNIEETVGESWRGGGRREKKKRKGQVSDLDASPKIEEVELTPSAERR